MSSKLVNVYENLKKNPDFNKKVKIEQPNPFDEDKKQNTKSDNGLNKVDENFIRELDRRIANKKQNKNKKVTTETEKLLVNKINKRFESIEETLKLIMETHKKIIKKLNIS